MPCHDCPKRAVCSQLCPEAEIIANQDYVSQRELPIGFPTFGRVPNIQVSVSFTFRERQVFSLMTFGFSRADISKTLNISRETLQKHFQNLNKKIK